MKDYRGKTVWIIGASSGIGRELALLLDRQGAKLILSATSEHRLRNLQEALSGDSLLLPLNVAIASDVLNATQVIQDKFNEIDSVILMAGLYTPMALSELNPERIKQIVDTNLMGAFHVIQAVLPFFAARKAGQLALCGSVAGYRGLPNGQPYSATKAAIINLAESLKSEHPYLDIKLISPGFVKTPMTDQNAFKMPMMIQANQAAQSIFLGLKSHAFEIHFPKKFTYLMKIIQFLPYFLYFKITKMFR